MDNQSTIRVFIIDEHPAVRQALATRLSATPHLHIVGSEKSGPHLSEHLHNTQTDVVLVGLNNRARIADSAHFVRHLARYTSVVVLTPYAVEAEQEELLAAGAKAYLLKYIDSNQLIQAIEKATPHH
jgi:DNA-binding NarL/FixJ family response regulator